MLVNDIFTPGAVRKWRDRIIEVIEARLDAITEPEFDLIAEYAGPIPTISHRQDAGYSSRASRGL